VAPVTVIDRNRESPQPSLDPLFRLLAADLDRVNALIVSRVELYPGGCCAAATVQPPISTTGPIAAEATA